MSLRAIPEHFGCDACQTVWPLDLLCHETHTRDTMLCLRCCQCALHGHDADPGGVAVFAAQAGKLTWRGLDGSLWRTRRHQ
jgi:hypothetical protein